MNNARWKQIDDLFGQALEIEEDRRGAFLSERCADDAELRRSVERLLALEVEAESFMAEPVAVGIERPAAEPSGALEGMRIGPYLLIQPIGHGGMGSVYLAHREDDYRQTVAIKLVRQGLGNEEARRRFRHERQVLARLEHPHIARLYDGGTTGEGRPYLVMEWVEGLPIDHYCDQHRLPVRRRLALFSEVCSVVTYAHRRLLVHCDLKPSNILVTADGAPKLLDFGIAKLLPAADAKETTLTKGSRPLTPAYASPEQIQGKEITTASDVYSLGVLLYQLLCGHLPFHTSRHHLGIEHLNLDQEPVSPSRRVSESLVENDGEIDSEVLGRRRGTNPRELASQLRGDLDAIVLKALRNDPQQRYLTVDELSADIRRHLELRPVRARRGLRSYRISRWLRRLVLPPEPRQRRERLFWAFLLAIALAVPWSVPALKEARVSCDGAAERMVGLWDSRTQSKIREAFLATELPFADDAWDRIEGSLGGYVDAWVAMHKETCKATYVRGEQSESMFDARMLCLEDRREELRALSRLLVSADEKLVKRALQVVGEMRPLAACADRRELAHLSRPPEDVADRRRIDDIRSAVEEQFAHYNTKRPIDFERLRQAVKTARELSYPPLLARALFVLGTAESFEGGNPEVGVEYLEDALLAAVAGGDRRLQTRIYTELIRVEILRNGNAVSAERWARYAEASLQPLGPGSDDLRFYLANAAGALAFETGRSGESKAHYQEALEIAESGSDPIRLIHALGNLGMFGETRFHEQAIEVAEREFGAEDIHLARPLVNLAVEHSYKNRFAEALQLVLRAIDIMETSYGVRHPDLGYPLTLAGQILSAEGRPDEAVVYLQRARSLIEASMGEKAPLVADVRHALANALRWLGRLAEAQDQALEADRIYAHSRPPTHPSRLALLATLGGIQREMGELPRALESHESLLEMIRGQEGSFAAMAWFDIAETLLEVGRHNEARAHLQKVLAADRGAANPLQTARIRFALARATWIESPVSSRQLAAEAAAGLGEEPPLQKQLKKVIEDWLDQKG